MSDAITLVAARLLIEEGKKPFAYNDADGKRVSCRPLGNLSVGIGINLETGLDDAEIEWLLEHRLGLVVKALSVFPWYVQCDYVRQSVFLDIGFNAGVAGLLRYPHMLSAAAKMDWVTASEQCRVSDPKLDASRYAPLRQLLLKGVA